MAKDSCIIHSQSSYYIELREDFFNLFDGDHCSGVLLSLFEFLTNIELTRFRLSGEDGEPWVKASMPKIYEETLGLYSIRALQSRIDFIEKCGFIKSTGDAGSVKRYLLAFEAVSEAIKGKRIYNVKNPGNFAAPAKPSAKPSAKTTENRGALNLKVESSILDLTHTEEVASPNEDLNLTEGKLTNVCWSMIVRARPKPVTNYDKQKQANERRDFGGWIAEQRKEYSQAQVHGGVSGYSRDPYWLEKGLPFAGLRSQFVQYVLGDSRIPTESANGYSASNRDSANGHTLFALQKHNGAVQSWKEDPEFVRFRENHMSVSDSIESDWGKAWTFWQACSPDERQKAIERIASCVAPYVKTPQNYLRDKEFERAPRQKKENKSMSQLLLEKLKNGEKV